MNKTRAKIIQAAIAELESTGIQTTTKQIAERAGFNELTLFRHFGSKQSLIVTAVSEALGPIANVSAQLSGDLHADLVVIIGKYIQLTDTHPGLFTQLLSTTDPVLIQTIVIPLQQRIVTLLKQLIDFHVLHSRLERIATEDLIRELMGPLLARAFLRHTIAIKPLDVDAYVSRFIRSHSV